MTQSKSAPTPLQRWLRIDAPSKPKVYAQVYDSADLYSLNYWLGIVFSAGIATFGLVLNSPAVIIGAMIISPLMAPIMATGLALAVGDLYLSVKAIANLLASILLAVGLSAILVHLLPFHYATAEILSRTAPNLLDLGVALLSGLAGSVAVARADGGEGMTTLPGVAIAVALMPPLCAVGFGLGSGPNTHIMAGAALLFLTNLVAIVSSAFVVFLLIGMGSPEVRSEIAHMRAGDAMAHRLENGPLGRLLSKGRAIYWRVGMLVVLLCALAIPLRTALLQLAGEAVTRDTVQHVVKTLLPTGAMVSQQVDVSRSIVTVRLFSTQPVSAEKIKLAEQEIQERSHRQASVTVESVASQSELAQLTERLSGPAPAPPKPPEKTLDQLHTELMARVSPIVTAEWPAEAPLEGFNVAFGPAGIVLNATYQAKTPLPPVALDLLTHTFAGKLETPGLVLNATRTAPPRTAPKPRKRKRPS